VSLLASGYAPPAWPNARSSFAGDFFHSVPPAGDVYLL
jgi:hypothetical protein